MKILRESLAALGVLLMLGMVAMHYSSLPATIPVHFNGRGVADGWGGKGELWGLIGVAAFIYAVMTVANFYPEYMISMPVKVARRPAALPMAVEMLSWVKFEITWMFLWICRSMIAVAQGTRTGLGAWTMPVMLCAMLGTVVFYYWRILRSPVQ